MRTHDLFVNPETGDVISQDYSYHGKATLHARDAKHVVIKVRAGGFQSGRDWVRANGCFYVYPFISAVVDAQPIFKTHPLRITCSQEKVAEIPVTREPVSVEP